MFVETNRQQPYRFCLNNDVVYLDLKKNFIKTKHIQSMNNNCPTQFSLLKLLEEYTAMYMSKEGNYFKVGNK
jgi:hypothetical protein